MTDYLAADHTNTSNPTVPTTYPVLYADEYGESLECGRLLK